MKSIFILLGLFYVTAVYSQKGCVDSSSHISYQSLLNDSFVVQKQLFTKNRDKIFVGSFYKDKNTVNRKDSTFIGKVLANGRLAWFKKVYVRITNQTSHEIEGIHEADNGNIFISFITSFISDVNDRKPYYYYVLSPNGTLINQQRMFALNILAATQPIRPDSIYVRAPLVARISKDSMLLGYYFELDNALLGVREALFTIVTDNDGNIGSAFAIVLPPTSTSFGYFNNAILKNGILTLLGYGNFYFTCSWPTSAQNTYYAININWATKQVVNRNAYCNPVRIVDADYVVLDDGGLSLGTPPPLVYPQANGNIIYARAAMGLEINSTDTINRLFAISEFDSNFNHIKSEYITTGNQFKTNAHYSIFIDSFNNRHIHIHDKPTNAV
jgi:hypothetical protein